MLLSKLATSLYHTHDKLLHTINKSSLHNQGLQILHCRVKTTGGVFRLLKSANKVATHLCRRICNLLLVLSL